MARKQDDSRRGTGAQASPQPAPRPRRGYQRQSVGEAIAKSFIRSIASRLGRILARAITGRMR
jgi:hypothetical protein